jgi:hypothetical protein
MPIRSIVPLMFTRSIRLSVASAVAAGTLLAAAGAASAVGPGTFTRITNPSGTTTFKFDGKHPSNNHLIVSGQTSADVTSVDIDCILTGPAGRSDQALATGVPVTGGAFSSVAPVSSLMSNCRLRAIPSGVDPLNDYIGSYAGPILYMSGAVYNTTGSTTYGYTALASQGDGLAAVFDAAQCGPAISTTIEPPGMQLLGTGSTNCAFTLPSSNVTAGSATASAIKVGGHNAYLPFSVHGFLNGTQALGLPQTALATTLTRSANGDVTVTESAPLKRCSVNDTYPPTHTSCPSLVNTGVTFTRTLNLFRGDHQIRVRDAFISSDGHAHTISLQYQGSIASPETGAVGYTFPGGSSTFHKTALNQVVTGLGTKANTMFVRSDLDSVEGDPEADTLGLTWSRAPQKVLFSGSTVNVFALPYALSVPANGAAHLGFAYSTRVETKDAKTLAAIAVNEMVNAPTISSPSNGAVIKGQTTTVKGSVTLGANGLPTNVVVNGHAAPLTQVSARAETYSVTFSESLGKHTVKVTAKDVAGNTRSKSISVTNVGS